MADASKPFDNVRYADPGYQSDKKARYPIDSRDHCRAAWSYINMPKNAKKYSANQLARIKSKIKAAAKKFGIDIQAEAELLTGVFEDALENLPAEVLEAYASMSLSNGGGQVSSSGYVSSPKDLKALAQKVAMAAITGISALDPDDDGDVDVSDADECASCGETIAEQSQFCPSCGHRVSEAAPPSDRKEPTVADFTTEQVKALLSDEQAAALDPVKESYSAEELQSLLKPAEPVKESKVNAEAVTALAKMLGLTLEDAPAKKEKPTREQKLEEARKLIAEEEAKANVLTTEQIIEAATKAAIEAMQAQGARDFRAAPSRKGLVASLEEAEKGLPDESKVAEMTLDELFASYSQTGNVGQLLSSV